MKKCALIAVCFNLATCSIISIILYVVLYVHARLDTYFVKLDDNFLEIYVKVTDITMHFFWFVLQSVGVLICARAIIGIKKVPDYFFFLNHNQLRSVERQLNESSASKEKIYLLAQYLIWKVVEMGSCIVHMGFGMNQHYENSAESSLGSLRFYYPISMLIYDSILLVIVFLFYNALHPEETDEEV